MRRPTPDRLMTIDQTQPPDARELAALMYDELRRLLLDLLTSVLLFADAALTASVRALPAVGALSLALGIALSSIVLEPATTAAAFGDEQP